MRSSRCAGWVERSETHHGAVQHWTICDGFRCALPILRPVYGPSCARRNRRSPTVLRKEQNDLLTQTGPGTPCGKLFRSYWLPALLADELPGHDCPPVRVKLLSERLLAFRDSSGRLGLIDEFCAHRGVSLWFGRNEEKI